MHLLGLAQNGTARPYECVSRAKEQVWMRSDMRSYMTLTMKQKLKQERKKKKDASNCITIASGCVLKD